MASCSIVAGFAAAFLIAQAPNPSWLKPASRVTAEATLEPARQGAPAGVIAVAVDVRPAPGIHVYAPGNKEYIAVDLAMTPAPGVKPGKVEYPRSEPFVFGELREVVQVYAKPFTIRLPILAEGPPREQVLALALRYQACTDWVCYPPATLPLEVTLPAR
jgi:DsbC/DsbD-like thiol-disulfide interchange protein